MLRFVLVALLLQGCAAQEGNLVQGQDTLTVQESLEYYLYYPPEYSPEGEPHGLLLFLHGGGESGSALHELKKHGPPKMMAEGYPFPFLVLAPQNPHKKRWWNIRAVKQLLDSVVAANHVDPNRIYLSGLSRGGSAAWEMAVQYPEKFAALAVVCGMAPAPYAHWLDKEMPIWVFHGVEDAVIPISESDDMVTKLREMGYTVTYSRYEGVGHNAWGKAYKTDRLYRWMAQQKRKP
ncbi:MAG: PHB depolymerase family esterase [Bacteroidota bacterium]